MNHNFLLLCFMGVWPSSGVGTDEVGCFLPDLLVVRVAQKQHSPGQLCHGLGKGRSLPFWDAAKYDAIAPLRGVPFLLEAHL